MHHDSVGDALDTFDCECVLPESAKPPKNFLVVEALKTFHQARQIFTIRLKGEKLSG